jgi:hypothetical protein
MMWKVGQTSVWHLFSQQYSFIIILVVVNGPRP